VANYPREASQRQRILTALYSADLTDDEIANETRLVGNSVRPRRRRLVQDGLVEDSGKRTSSNFGHPAVVWTLTEEGLRVAKELADD
jgi:predicted ArsR family transcriptional regulator